MSICFDQKATRVCFSGKLKTTHDLKWKKYKEFAEYLTLVHNKDIILKLVGYCGLC